MQNLETKLIANALYEIRLVLGSYIGSKVEAPLDVRFAAHLAYALHNEALALAAGTEYDVANALRKVGAIDGIIGSEDSRRLAKLWSGGEEDVK